MKQELEPLISVKKLKKHFPVYSKGFFNRPIGNIKAVDNVSFDIKPGETLGLVGESGCGKTTTAKTILRALLPTSGSVEFRVEDSVINLAKLDNKQIRPLRKKMQMIFQDPFSSLNPRMTICNIVGEPLKIHKIAKGRKLKDKVAETLIKVGLKAAHMNRYPHTFSGGQRQRIGIARALIMKPSFIIADEAVSALDVSVQAQIINLLKDLQKQFGLTYLFVAHDLSVVEHMCDRVAVMYAGKIVEIARTKELFDEPRHPYTKALMAAVPYPDPYIKMKYVLTGEPADLANLPSGCSFHPRCNKCFEPCSHNVPKLKKSSQDRFTACHLFG